MDRARRRFAAVLVASSFGDTLAQEKPRTRRVGVLLNGAAGSAFAVNALDVLRKSFASLGYEEGRDVALEPRYADLQLERLPALAADLAAAKVDVMTSLLPFVRIHRMGRRISASSWPQRASTSVRWLNTLA